MEYGPSGLHAYVVPFGQKGRRLSPSGVHPRGARQPSPFALRPAGNASYARLASAYGGVGNVRAKEGAGRRAPSARPPPLSSTCPSHTHYHIC